MVNYTQTNIPAITRRELRNSQPVRITDRYVAIWYPSPTCGEDTRRIAGLGARPGEAEREAMAYVRMRRLRVGIVVIRPIADERRGDTL